jgi:hypothetical protein
MFYVKQGKVVVDAKGEKLEVPDKAALENKVTTQALTTRLARIYSKWPVRSNLSSNYAISLGCILTYFGFHLQSVTPGPTYADL